MPTARTTTTAPKPKPKPYTRRRGKHPAEATQRPDLPYTMRLPDGRTLYVEVPGRHVQRDRDGEPAFNPEGVAFLDRIRALAMPLTQPPSPGYIARLREALGMTQRELGERLGVNLLTVSRWERGTRRPNSESMKRLRDIADTARRRGVVLPG